MKKQQRELISLLFFILMLPDHVRLSPPSLSAPASLPLSLSLSLSLPRVPPPPLTLSPALESRVNRRCKK